MRIMSDAEHALIQEKLIQEKISELSRFLFSEDIFTSDDFLQRVADMQTQISVGNHPEGAGRRITATADRDFYSQALDAIETQFTPYFERAEVIYSRLNIANRDQLAEEAARVGAVLNAQPNAPNHQEESFAVRIAMRRYESEFLQQEQEEVESENRWFLGLWNDYKNFTIQRSETDFNESQFFSQTVLKLQNKGWQGLDEELLRDLFDQTVEIEELIEVARNTFADLTLEDFESIEESLEELHNSTQPTETGIAETQVLYNRLLMKYQALKKAWLVNIDANFIEGAKKQGLRPNQLEKYEDYLDSLEALENNLRTLVTNDARAQSLGSISVVQKKYLNELYETVIENNRLLNVFQSKIPEQDLLRLNELYDRITSEAEILLGVQLDELESIFTDDVEWWLFAYHGEQWRRTQRLWQQYQAGNVEALILFDKLTIEELISYFSAEIQDLDENDVAYNQRFIALDIQLNRLQKMHSAMKEATDKKAADVAIATPAGPGELEEDTLNGDLPRPNTESKAAYDDWLKKRLEIAERNPEIYNRILHQIHELIIERLHNIKQVSREWKDYSLLEAYSLIYKYIEIDPASPNVVVMTEIKIKSAEIEKIRTITDVAHEHGVSKAMVSNWEGFKDHDGANGLIPIYYDYFCQEWGDGETRENGEENRYAHAILMNKTIDAYLEWLRFGEGTHWSDGPLWKAKAKEFCMNFAVTEATANGTVLSEYEKDEFYGLLYNMVYGLGIRQHAFIDQHAVGATPSGDLGVQWHYVADTQFLPTFWYNVYKEAEFLPVEGIFDVPVAWLRRCRDAGLIDKLRITNINRSRRLTRQVMEIFGPPRKPAKIGLKRGYDGTPINFEGRDLSTAYDTLFEAIFLKAKARKEQRDDPNKEYDFTFASFIYGHKAFVNFRKAFMDVPGKLFGKFDKDTPHEEIKDKVIEAVDSKKPEELITILSNEYKYLINKHFSYLKKNWFSVDPNQVAYALLGYVDRIFRIMSLSSKVKLEHRYKLLSEIRKITRDGANMAGLCKRDEIYGVDAQEPIAWKKYKSMDEHGATSEVTRNFAKYDVRDFILNRLPNTAEDYEGRNVLARMLKPIANVADAPITIVGDFKDRQRIAPPAWDNTADHGTDRIKLWWSLRKAGLSDTFRRTMYYAFGVPEAAQKSPDAK